MLGGISRLFSSKGPRQTSLTCVVDSGHAEVDVVFVHGLDGAGIKSWRFDEKPSWQTWLKDACSSARILTLDYRLRSTEWAGGSMPLTDRALNVLATLHVELTEQRPIVFVCHSYGGLLVKQMLRTAHETATEYRGLATRVKGIVFLGTPHSGSGVAKFLNALPRVVRSSVTIRELERSGPQLRELSQWFTNSMHVRPLAMRCYFETVDTKGMRIVDEDSANPHIPGVIPVGIDANHVGICKPFSPDLRVKQTAALINEAATKSSAAGQRDPSYVQQMLMANDVQLTDLGRQVKSKLKADPANDDLISASSFYDRMKGQAREVLMRESEMGFHNPSSKALARSLFIFATVPIVLLDKIAFNDTGWEWLKHLFENLKSILS
jgi:pimeloyl-ACP methyl ester carboxylesterase